MASQRQIHVGGVPIGGGAPVAVQTMTKTETANLTATMDQIRTVAEAGADIVRVAVPREKDVEALKTIVVESPIPIIADIHFNHTLALKAIDAGAHCIRLNPGNIGGPEKVAEVADRAKAAGTPMRIGVNSGSLPKHLHELERENPVEALVGAAVEYVELMERLGFEDFKVSIKSTSVPNTIASNRMLAERIDCPTCGRLQFDMDTVVAEIEERLRQYDDPIEVAVLGCAVNGIGEASHADFGITGAKNEGLIFAHGKPLRKVPQDELVDALFVEIDKSIDKGSVLVDEREAAEGAAWLEQIEEENAGEMTPERIAAMEAAAATEDALTGGQSLPMAGTPKAKRIALDEESSPTAGRRFTRA